MIILEYIVVYDTVLVSIQGLDQRIYFFSPIPTAFFAFVSSESSLWFEFEEKVSPAFWPALLSDWG
jgi:hypothetical protein